MSRQTHQWLFVRLIHQVSLQGPQPHRPPRAAIGPSALTAGVPVRVRQTGVQGQPSPGWRCAPSPSAPGPALSPSRSLSSVCLSTSRRWPAGKQPIGRCTRRGTGRPEPGGGEEGARSGCGDPHPAQPGPWRASGAVPPDHAPQPHPQMGTGGPRDGDGPSSRTQASCLLGGQITPRLGKWGACSLCTLTWPPLVPSSGPGLCPNHAGGDWVRAAVLLLRMRRPLCRPQC